MPLCKFLKPYQNYTVGQVVDLPGRLSYKLRTAGVVVKVATPAPAFGAVKHAAKKAAKRK